MKIFILALLLLFCLSSARGQGRYSDIEKKAYSFYNNKTEDSFIYYSKLAIQDYEDSNDDLSIARNLQNLGFYFQDQRLDYPNAFVCISFSIDKWRKLKDTTSEANLLKYIGLTCEYLGYHKTAIEEEDSAISLFRKMNFESGIYVALFDLGIVYQHQENCTKAKECLTTARNYWLTKKDAMRLFAINNYLLKCINDRGSQEFKDLVNENNTYLGTAKIPNELVEIFNGLNK